MEKKKGAALVWVLLVFAVVLIVGTAIYSFVANTSKLNSNLRINTNLKIGSNSGISLGEYYLVNEKNYKNIRIGENVEVNNTYINEEIGLFNSTFKENKFNNYKLNINIQRVNKILYVVTSKASYKDNEEIEKANVIINVENEKSIKNIDKFMNDIAGITILNGNTFNVSGGTFFVHNAFYFTNSTVNILGEKNISGDSILNNYVDDSLDSDYINISNNKNTNNTKMKRSKGLDLAFSNGSLNLNQLTLMNKELKMAPGDVYLLSSGYMGTVMQKAKLDNLTKAELNNYTGALVRMNDGSYVLVNNGNLTISNLYIVGEIISYINYHFNNRIKLFMYSTGTINLDNAPMYLNDSSIISNNGINISYSDIYINGNYKVTPELKSVLLRFMKKN